MGMGLGTLGAVVVRCCTVIITGVSYCVGLLRATAFWGTIILPLVIVGGLLTNIATSAPSGLAVLVGLNVLCIVLGRSYRTSV